MNLHAIANPIIQVVNPNVPAYIQYSTGNTINEDGSQTPTYTPPVLVSAQVQSLTFRDLQQIEGLNLQGTRRAIYLYGDIEAIVRVTAQGGDLVTFPGRVGGFANNTTWLVAENLETWLEAPDCWCKVAATLQMDTYGSTLSNP
jgi:hypothetical protein